MPVSDSMLPHPGTIEATSPASLPSSTQTYTIAPKFTPTFSNPQPVLLAVPERWGALATQVIDTLDPQSTFWQWQLLVSEDPQEMLSQGFVNLALVPGEDGVPAGERALALGVHFKSDWENVTLIQAQDYVERPSPFVAVMDWANMTPKLKALLVDGKHPSDPAYPLKESWSLIAEPRYEAAAQQIGPLMHERISHDPVAHLVAVGDIMLDRGPGEAIENGNPVYPFENVFALLTCADITLGNLESALGDQGSAINKNYTFRAPPEAALSFALAGFDLLSLANNHAMDYGPTSLLEGISLLQARGIRTVGAGENVEKAHSPIIFTSNDTTIAFLAYVDVPIEVHGFDTKSWSATQTQPGVAWADASHMKTDIVAVRPMADVVIVLLHSGFEYVLQPSIPQVTASRTAIDAGADLVLGHHAHILQGVEFYHHGVIVYGLGNFVFEGGDITQSIMLDLWVDSNGLRGLALKPLTLSEDGRPRLATETEAEEIRAIIYAETTEVGSP